MAQHQADIDTNHKTGWQWKHSPRHTETRAEFGHTFTRGLLETWFLTGNRHCLEAALELGDFFAREIRNPRALGNERQIGWALISLLPVYEATWDPRFFEPAKAAVNRLLDGLDARGRFAIRWDNRIAFFNGIAATGLLYYYRATGDERVAEAALRVIGRTKGFYPEYAGRTLEVLAWAATRTQDPEFEDLLARTWETSTAWQLGWGRMELGAPTIFTAHALPSLARSRLFPPVDHPLGLTPQQFDSADGRSVQHLSAGEADLYLDLDHDAPLRIVVVRKGAWKAPGAATLHDPAGQPVGRIDFPREAVVWQRREFTLDSPRPGPWRLDLRAPNLPNDRAGYWITWDVATSRPLAAVFATPGHRGLEMALPALYTRPAHDADQIRIELVGEGEGFKKADLSDPDGNVVACVDEFIDLGDPGRYRYVLTAPVAPGQRDGVWRLLLQDVSVARLSGLRPYFATHPARWFAPDHQANPMPRRLPVRAR
jgi:hypothetical protein